MKSSYQNAVLSRGIQAAKLKYSHHSRWGITVLLGVLNVEETRRRRTRKFEKQKDTYQEASPKRWR